MSTQDPEETTGRLDHEAVEREESSTTGGMAGLGEYDAAQGSPDGEHPVGEDFPDEAVRYGDEERHRSDTQD